MVRKKRKEGTSKQYEKIWFVNKRTRKVKQKVTPSIQILMQTYHIELK